MRFFVKTRTITLVLVTVFTFNLAQATLAEESQSLPNFVFIYADDWRWDCLGVVQREQAERARFPWLKTPHMDELAASSLRFRNAFVVNSLCSPGRACVLTGQYSHRNGIIGNQQPMDPHTPTLATRLADAGYNTAYCGKFHMNGQRQRPGFGYVASFIGQGRYNDCPILLNGQETPTTGWIDDVSTDHAIAFLNKQKSTKPFFLFLGFKSVHGPRGGENLPERSRGLYANDKPQPTPNLGLRAIFTADAAPQNGRRPGKAERGVEGARAYMRHVSAIDDCVGRVLDTLQRADLDENTYIIVTSDNGYYLGEHGLGDKRSAYEESIRVPLLIRVPGKKTVRGLRDQMVLNIDHTPTILNLAGAQPLPEMHGQNMQPLLTSEPSASWRTQFLYEYFKEGRFASPTVVAVRTAQHKLIKYPGHDEWTELFDLENDPYETKNLADDAELIDALQKRLDEQFQATSFKMPTDTNDSADNPARDRKPRPNRKKRSPI